MNFDIDIINALVILAALANMVYGLVVYSRNRKDATNFSFFVLTLAVSAWGVGMFLFRGFGEINMVVLSARMLYIAAATIPLTFLYFIFIFPHEKSELTDQQRYLLPLPFLAIVGLSLWPNGLIETVRFVAGTEDIIVFNPTYHLLYALYIVGYFGAGYFLLFQRLKTALGLYRQQILYILSGTLIATLIGVATNLVLPLVGIFTLNWFGQVGTIVMIGAISYAILKHHLFNVRVIATEIFVAALWVFVFIRFFLSINPQDKFADGIMLFVSIVLGIWLIRSVQKEVEHAEKEAKHARQVEKLASELEESNKRQKNLLHEINHDVKEMLTEATGAFANLLDGDYGVLPTEARVLCEVAFKKVRAGTRRVMDFLHATNLEKGTVQFEMKSFNLRQMLEKVVKDNEDAAKEKGLALVMRVEDGEYPFTGDENQLALHVFDNLLKNAIIFTPKGSVVVSLSKRYGKIMVAMKDTGVGITEEDKKNLFTPGGHGKDSMKINVHSTGNGLFIAKSTVLAHGGKIWAESAGAGKGAAFFVELPIVA